MTNDTNATANLRDHQYKTPDNLMVRAALYKRFGMESRSIDDIRLEVMALKPEESVIDFGCGNGLAWQAAQKRGHLPASLTLVDLSKGMLDAAREALGEDNVEYVLHDLNEPLEVQRQFDVLTAFHMLYHLDEPLETLGSMLRHLNQGGRAFVILNARDHLQELPGLIDRFEGTNAASKAMILPPSLDVVETFCANKFACIERHDIAGGLNVTEAAPLIDYIFSADLLHGGRYETADARARFEEHVRKEVDDACKSRDGYRIRTHAVLMELSGKL